MDTESTKQTQERGNKKAEKKVSGSCRILCTNWQGLIQKYGLNMCQQCFRQYMKDIGFIKLY
uniref:Small ribosomal subunit protein uS14 n=1 Tax=Sciurus vulgaris TaxID=55149 RepID=A0A8D2JTL2_SCIVU